MSDESKQLSEAFYKVNALLQEQRDSAYDAARKRIAGDEPRLRYEKTQSRFSPRFMLGVQIMIAFMMIVAFLPSAMRIHAVALIASAPLFGTGTASQYLTAVCVVALAEVCQIAFSVALATASNCYERIAYAIGAAFGTAIALVGNGAAVKMNISIATFSFTDAFTILETFAPPVITLIAAWVLKSQSLHEAELRTKTQSEHAIAINAWKAALANAPKSNEWNNALANALRDALRIANRRSYAVVRELTDSDWRALVLRERKAEEWWKEEEQRITQLQERTVATQSQTVVRNGTVSTAATGEVANARTKRNGAAFVKICPHCVQEFEGETERQATNRLVAHMKKHSNERKAAQIIDATDTTAVSFKIAS